MPKRRPRCQLTTGTDIYACDGNSLVSRQRTGEKGRSTYDDCLICHCRGEIHVLLNATRGHGHARRHWRIERHFDSKKTTWYMIRESHNRASCDHRRWKPGGARKRSRLKEKFQTICSLRRRSGFGIRDPGSGGDGTKLAA